LVPGGAIASIFAWHVKHSKSALFAKLSEREDDDSPCGKSAKPRGPFVFNRHLYLQKPASSAVVVCFGRGRSAPHDLVLVRTAHAVGRSIGDSTYWQIESCCVTSLPPI
jgi:hypothetical protein